MTFELLDQYTVVADGTTLNPDTVDQNIASITVAEGQQFRYYMIHCDIEIIYDASGAAQALDFEILNDTTTVKTFNYTVKNGSADSDSKSITHLVAKNTTGTITLRLGNATADANTDIIPKNFWVAGVS